MQIDLPQDTVDRVQQRVGAAQGATEADVIRQALDSLDRQHEQSVADIRESATQYEAGKGIPVDKAFAEVRSDIAFGQDSV